MPSPLPPNVTPIEHSRHFTYAVCLIKAWQIMQSAPRTHGAAPPSPVTRPLLHISSWEGVGTSASYPSLALRAIQDKLDGGVDNKTLPETQQTNLRGGAHHFVTKDPTNPLSVGALSPFRESYWDKIRTLNVQRNHQIIHEARQQLEKMLGESDARFIALGILSSLNRTQMVLLSCATVTGGQDFFALANCRKSRVWRDEERTCFCLKFTSFVPGRWYMEDILDVWEEFFKVSKWCRQDNTELTWTNPRSFSTAFVSCEPGTWEPHSRKTGLSSWAQ